jgi:hypothetical protein
MDNVGKFVPADQMTDRELLEECVGMLRVFAEAFNQLGQSPMFAAMMPSNSLSNLR